ncbi:MAG: CAAX prenyl protease-related protein [Euryarchaeota archaeon]|nr:CAAX prenyl protease-related protein [Euryarchaeota archaeon]
MTLETRLNTISVSVIACIALVYICTFINSAVALTAFFSVVPLYWFVQRNHARYAVLDKIWHLGGAWKYVFPFVIYLVIGELVCNLLLGYDAHYHIYVAYTLRTVIVGGILVRYRSLYTELTDWKFDVPALLVGVLIFALWVGLEGHYPMFSGASNQSHFDPSIFGTDMLILLLCVRLVGSVLVAAFIEELFTRSFLMRYVIDPARWAEVPVGMYTFTSFMVVALFFGFAHFRWLPGILTGILLNLLLYKRRNIFACVEAHAMANLLLFFYVLYTGSWFFW